MGLLPLDFLPRPSTAPVPSHKPLLPWLIRRVECIRGNLPLILQCAPAFNYARDTHTTAIINDSSVPLDRDQAPQKKILFESENLSLDLRYVVEATELCTRAPPAIELCTLDLTSKGHIGLAACASLQIHEGQAVTFILREPPPEKDGRNTTVEIDAVEQKLIMHSPRALNDPFLTKVTFYLGLSSLVVSSVVFTRN
jgi:hypothetical protein